MEKRKTGCCSENSAMKKRKSEGRSEKKELWRKEKPKAALKKRTMEKRKTGCCSENSAMKKRKARAVLKTELWRKEKPDAALKTAP